MAVPMVRIPVQQVAGQHPVVDQRGAPPGDGVFRLGATSMSDGSHTEPGGYAEPSDAEQQFEVADERSPSEEAARSRAAGYAPVWKDTIGARRQS